MSLPSPPAPPASAGASGAPVIAPGAWIDGKYRVERVLGMGGMGLVVAAVHVALDRKVAIKLLRANDGGGTGDAASIERMLREARAVAGLRSAHVARVIDVVSRPSASGDDATPPYIVMEYLHGEDLAARLRAAGPLSVGDASSFVLQACEAIAEAHASGIVHRDLKPANLFLTTRVDGQPLVKVLDFGISKVTGPSPAALSLTRTADLIGTPLYMAPEQLRHARSVDPRTDQWALGVILFELVTGQLPFPATSLMELCARVLESDAPSVRSLRADVPAPIAEAIARCLRRDPAERFASVADLAAALEPFAVEAGGAERGAAARIRAIAVGRAREAPGEHAASTEARRHATPASSASPASALATDRTDAAWGQTASPIAARRLGRPTRLALKAGVVLALVAGVTLVTRARLRGSDPSRPPLEVTASVSRDGAAPVPEAGPYPSESPPREAPFLTPEGATTARAPRAPTAPPRRSAPVRPSPSHMPAAPPALPDAGLEDDFPTRN